MDAAFVPFLMQAKLNTYAAANQPERLARAAQPASRPASHDLAYCDGPYRYLDTYLGGFAFIGEEAVWRDERPLWGMNYYGAMLVDTAPPGFGDFLKLALSQPPPAAPYRGPAHFSQGRFTYRCVWQGDLARFSGEEWIDLDCQPIYHLSFHGGAIQ